MAIDARRSLIYMSDTLSKQLSANGVYSSSLSATNTIAILETASSMFMRSHLFVHSYLNNSLALLLCTF